MDINKIFEMLKRSRIEPVDIGKFPTIYQQTGQKRSGPVALIQDNDVLLQVSKFNYDHTVPEFQIYCRDRGVPCFDIMDWAPGENEDPHGAVIAQIHAAKMQDCWELYMREIRAIDAEDYTKPRQNNEKRLQELLTTIYRKRN